MNCLNHPDTPAVAYCRMCGNALCEACQRLSAGTVFCAEHVPPQGSAAATPAPSPWTAPPPPPPPPNVSSATSVSPGLAFLLGLIPGVGAIYNAQYAKGLVHVLVFGLLISIMNSGAAHGLEPLFGLALAGWYFYMPFEAYHTAKKRQLGEPVDEFSSLVPLRGSQGRFPVAPIVLIAVGVLFLLNNLEILRFYQIANYWPVFLIALGAYMLWARVSDRTNDMPGGH